MYVLHPFLYVLGDIAYEWSFKINNWYNKFRKLFGLQYWSLSQYLKKSVKNAISFINDFKILSLKKIHMRLALGKPGLLYVR